MAIGSAPVLALLAVEGGSFVLWRLAGTSRRPFIPSGLSLACGPRREVGLIHVGSGRGNRAPQSDDSGAGWAWVLTAPRFHTESILLVEAGGQSDGGTPELVWNYYQSVALAVERPDAAIRYSSGVERCTRLRPALRCAWADLMLARAAERGGSVVPAGVGPRSKKPLPQSCLGRLVTSAKLGR